MQERKTIDTLKHALAINAERSSQDPAPTDAASNPPLAWQELRAVIQEMARKEAERLCSDRM